MNVLGPPKKARGELASKTARKLIARAHYGVLTLLANVFGAPFWLFEQQCGRWADLLDNKRSNE